MGVPGFFYHLIREDKGHTLLKHDLAGAIVDILYLDANCLFHPQCFKVLDAFPEASSRAFVEVKMFQRIKRYIDFLTNVVQPKSQLIISVDGTKENIKVYINPTISPGGGLETNEEGCLSVPGIFTNIKRYKTCKVTATDLQGNEFSEQGQELLTRAMQHENDHLEGITIVDKMGHSAKILHRKQLKKLIENQAKSEE